MPTITEDLQGRPAVLYLVLPWVLVSAPLLARPLDPARWRMSGPNADALRMAIDNDIRTSWRSPQHQTRGLGVLIDLQRSVYVHRVFLTPGEDESWFPRSLRVLIGETPETLELAAEQEFRDEGDQNLRHWDRARFHPVSSIKFSPRKGRYVRLEVGDNTAGCPWAIAELEIYAATKQVPPNRWNVVIVAKDAPYPLQLAATELRYYLTELTDTPTRIVAPEDAGSYEGLRVRLADPPPEKLPYPDPDPPYVEDVSVVREGKDIVISGPTQRAVLYGAYELLDRQGVRWLYPDSHGDCVPSRGELDLSVLPIKYRPPFASRYANFGIDRLSKHSKTEDGRLFFVRHHFNDTWGSGLRATLGGIPPRRSLGFGYIHNLRRIVPESVVEQHPDWTTGPYRKGWCKVPCTSNPEVIDYVVQRLKQESESQPHLQGFSIHPEDVPAWCECKRCTKLFGKPRKVDEGATDEAAHAFDYSDHYFHLINEVAKRAKQELPGKIIFALAYANHGRPPRTIERLPDNVAIDITLHWKHNLPVSSPKNRSHKEEIEAWAKKCGHVGIYDYVLIHTDTTFGRPAGEWYLLAPFASPIVGHQQFFHQLGATAVGTQAMGDVCRCSPWSVYAYARSAWNPTEPAETVLRDFFSGFYRNAGEPMLKWYKTLEDHVTRNDIAMGGNVGSYQPIPEAFPDPVVQQMRAQLREADKRATKWYVRQRIAHAAKCLNWSYELAHEKRKRDVYPCYRVATAPTIDGRLDDEVWETLPQQTGFRIATTDHYAFTRRTGFRVGWDAENLYVGVRCVEPNVAGMRERNPGEPGYIDIAEVSWSKFYHDLIELFLVPDDPIYFQVLANAAGQHVGPNRHVGRMHNRRPISREGFAYKMAYGSDCWTLEMRLPFSGLGYRPSDGERWKANLVRVASQDTRRGEQFSSWPHVQRFNFHERTAYNYLLFRDSAASAQERAAAEKALNDRFLSAAGEYDAFQKTLAAFEERVANAVDLCAGAGVLGMGRNPRVLTSKGLSGEWSLYGKLPQAAVVHWREPVEISAVRIYWADRKEFPEWYGLEWYDGQSYRPLAENRDNQFEISRHEFETVKTTRLRLTIYRIEGRSNVTLARRVQAFGP